jgi:competence protein ComEC
MKVSDYPVFRLLISLLLGIVLAHFLLPFSIRIHWIWPLLIFLAVISWINKPFFAFRIRVLTGVLIHISFVLIGIFTYQNHFDQVYYNYFGNHLADNQKYWLKITEPPQEKDKSVKTIVSVLAIADKNGIKQSQGKAIIYFAKDAKSLQLKYGDYLAVNKTFQLVEAPQNPDQFDYQSFLALKDIHYQLYLRAGEWKKSNYTSKHGVKYYALSLRNKMLKVLKDNHLKDDELSVAAGMLLGLSDLLSPEIMQAYSGSGAMHVLSVSGLHVGIIFLALNVVLSFLDSRPRGKIIKAIITFFAIWFYALLTGLSPSVVRAAAMFSFILIGQNLSRYVNIYNSLATSAFVILLFNPTLLFNVGFQLSYFAVIAIVVFQKPFSQIWTPSNKYVNQVWQLIAVSLAAQIGTAPLSIYYFHQFPNLFLLTNLIVIPAAYLVINLGILLIFLSFIPPVADFLGLVLSYLLRYLNQIIIGIEQWHYAVIRDLYLSLPMFVISFLLVISISVWLINRQKKLIFLNLILLALLVFANQFKYDIRNEFTIYQTNKQLYMAIYSNREAWIICDSVTLADPSSMDFQVSGHELRKGIKKRHYYPIDKKIMVQGAHFMIHYPMIHFDSLTFCLNPSVAEQQKRFDKYWDRAVLFPVPRFQHAQIDSQKEYVLVDRFSKYQLQKLFPDMDKLPTNVYSIKEKGAFSCFF